MAATEMRKSRSINDYPEHLNPFNEEDNHRGIRFWTLSRKSVRNSTSNFSLNNIKDLRNTWSLKSFMRKNKKKQENIEENATKTPVNGESSPVVFRRALQYGATPGRGSERYVHRGSVTPLPRSRFQERLRVTTPPAPTNLAPNNFTHMAPGRASFSHGAGGGSRISVVTVASVNPFDEDAPADVPQAPVRRKKKRAPPPPPCGDTSATSANTSTASVAEEIAKKDDITEDSSFNIELKIVEEADEKPKSPVKKEETPIVLVTTTQDKIIEEVPIVKTSPEKTNMPVTDVESDEVENNNVQKEITSTPNSPIEFRNKKQDSEDSKGVVFEKVNIRLYRRNSSLSSDFDKQNAYTEISPQNKRSKSLSNNMNVTFAPYDVPLHIDEDKNEVKDKDINDNQAPQKVVCKLLNADMARKPSADNSISSTEREFIEIDRATRQLEQEISKLNSFRYIDDTPNPRESNGYSVSQIKSRFENAAMHSPNPIPKPQRSPRAGSLSPVRQLTN